MLQDRSRDPFQLESRPNMQGMATQSTPLSQVLSWSVSFVCMGFAPFPEFQAGFVQFLSCLTRDCEGGENLYRDHDTHEASMN